MENKQRFPMMEMMLDAELVTVAPVRSSEMSEWPASNNEARRIGAVEALMSLMCSETSRRWILCVYRVGAQLSGSWELTVELL